jgi:hypothetical protein
MDVKSFSTKWGAFADDSNSPLADMGNESAWDRRYKRESEEFRRRQRAKIVASTPHLTEERFRCGYLTLERAVNGRGGRV